MAEIFSQLVDVVQGKHPVTVTRSGKWTTVRKAHLKLHPVCEVCGGASKLEVHHRIPFHLEPALELDPGNLLTLCESKKMGINCHLFVGHLGNYKNFNPTVVTDAAMLSAKIRNRP